MEEDANFVRVENWTKCSRRPPGVSGSYLLRHREEMKPVVCKFDALYDRWSYRGIQFWIADCEWAQLPE